MAPFYVQCKQVFCPHLSTSGSVIAVNDGTVVDIVDRCDVPQGARVIDHSDLVAGPGLIDLHCHGAAGSDFADGSVEDTERAARHHLSQGTTSLLATVASCPPPQTLAALESTRRAMGAVPNIRGAHLEGPWFSRAWQGCHLPQYLRDPGPEELDSLEPYRELIGEVTLAPELPGALDAIRRFRPSGTVFSVGHSDATHEQLLAAIDAGLSHSTHIFNAMPRARRNPIVLEPGVFESILLLDQLTTEIIGDAIHVGPQLVELVVKIKGPSNTALVSDALRGVGAGPGDYAFGPRDGQMCRIIEEPQVGVVPGSDPLRLASSAITLADSLRILSSCTSVPLEQLWEMASLTPARILGIESRKGHLNAGADADLVLFDTEMRVAAVYAVGKRQDTGHTV